MKSPDWNTRGRLPQRIKSLDGFEIDADGCVIIPHELFLEGEIEWLGEEFERTQNPVLAWAAIFQIEHHLRTHGGAIEYAPWLRDYLASAASELLLIDPDTVPATKMPHAISKALRLTQRGGGPGYIQRWRRLMGEREAADAAAMGWNESEATALLEAVEASRAMPSAKHDLKRQINRNRGPKKTRN